MVKKAIFDKKNVLVTGGAGFIGSHLCDELIKDSKVICLDNFSTGDEKNIDHLLAEADFTFIKHDINEPIDFEKFPELQKFKIQFQGIQEIYHLACPTSPINFEKNKMATLLANSYGVKNVLDIALKYKAKFLHFSSAVVYGPRQEDNKKIKEDNIGKVDFLSERSSYDEGKRFAETIILNYRHVYNIDAKILRVFRVYGPRMKLDEGHMIPDFISNALDNKDLVIFGDNNFSSSFCYVSDIIDAAVKMMQSSINDPINIGSDVDINVTDIAQKIIKTLDSKSKITYVDKILFMTPLCLPDITKARNELGWMPIVTIEKGLEKTIDDLRASKRLKRAHSI
jgi:UDP-glucuronate decarboxylase